MALHPDFPLSPYDILSPAQSWSPADLCNCNVTTIVELSAFVRSSILSEQTLGSSLRRTTIVKFSDFAGLRTLAEVCKERFTYGIVFYDSTDLVPFGYGLAAAPLSSLWG